MNHELAEAEKKAKAKAEAEKKEKPKSVKKDIAMSRNGMETKCSEKALQSFLDAGWVKGGK